MLCIHVLPDSKKKKQKWENKVDYNNKPVKGCVSSSCTIV